MIKYFTIYGSFLGTVKKGQFKCLSLTQGIVPNRTAFLSYIFIKLFLLGIYLRM